jgi:hypothetical protein
MSYLTEQSDIQLSTLSQANANTQMPSQTVAHAKTLDWHTILAAWEQSGQTQREFCKAQGIKPHIFSYYRGKHQRMNKPKQKFARVKLSGPDVSSSSLGNYQLKLPSGAVLSIPQSYEPSRLKPLLVLLGACA